MSEGWIGMEEFKHNLLAVAGNISGPVLREALYAGAAVFRQAIESATPIGKAQYTYTRNGKTRVVKSRRPVGQARANVIVYQRQFGLSQEAGGLSLLIGHEKKHAFYMYWMEYGSVKQTAHPFMRPVFDSTQESAMKAARDVLARGLGSA